jgi:hypothetical protein
MEKASPYLRTHLPTQDKVHKPSTTQTICESLDKILIKLHSYEV